MAEKGTEEMEIVEGILTAVSVFFGCSTFVGWLLYHNANKRLKDTEAKRSEWQLEADRIKELRDANHTLNETITDNAARISELNHALDGKTDRIRMLTDELIKAQTERIADAEEKARLRWLVQFYKQWHCRREQNESEDGCLRREPKQKHAIKYTDPDE